MNKKIISLEIPEQLKESLRAEAFQQNMSISALIRKILWKSVPIVELPEDTVASEDTAKHDR